MTPVEFLAQCLVQRLSKFLPSSTILAIFFFIQTVTTWSRTDQPLRVAQVLREIMRHINSELSEISDYEIDSNQDIDIIDAAVHIVHYKKTTKETRIKQFDYWIY